jgi:hypothetical protein
MTANNVPHHHWRSYGNDPLPTPQKARREPFAAPRSDLPLRTILARMRHERCGGRPAKAELLTGTEAASSGPVRRIV